jgi:hypothetical protein
MGMGMTPWILKRTVGIREKKTAMITKADENSGGAVRSDWPEVGLRTGDWETKIKRL